MNEFSRYRHRRRHQRHVGGIRIGAQRRQGDAAGAWRSCEHGLRWTLAGSSPTGRHPSELPLAAAAVYRWKDLDEELDAETEYRQNGNIRLALSEADVPTIKGVVAASLAAGIESTYLDAAADIRAIAPALCDEMYGASYCPTDGHANPAKSVLAFAAAAKRHGAAIRTGVDVIGITTAGGKVTGVETNEGPVDADRVIVAAGIYAGAARAERTHLHRRPRRHHGNRDYECART